MASIELFGNWWGHVSYDEIFHENEASPTANAVGVKSAIYNCSGKTIKYLTFAYTPINSVNDKCDDTKYAKLTGPMEPNSGGSVFFEHLWFNPTINKVEIESIEIEYSDGSSETVKGDEITHILTPEAEKHHVLGLFDLFHNLSEEEYKTFFCNSEKARGSRAEAWKFNEESAFFKQYKDDFERSIRIGLAAAQKESNMRLIIAGVVVAVFVLFCILVT